MIADREYRTPQGDRAWYATTPFRVRQHLAMTMFPRRTLCGHPTSDWSNQPIRTPIGMTCLWCRWRVRRGGTELMTPTAAVWYPVAWAIVGWDRVHRWRRKRSQRGGSDD